MPEYSITEKCSVLNVTKQGYYQWLRSLNKPYKYTALLAIILAVLNEDPENKGNYGARRVFLRLKQPEYGYGGSCSTVYRVMKANGLLQKKKRNPNGLTKEDRAAQKSENLIRQDFTASEPNSKWLSDITEVPTADGKLYLAPVLDGVVNNYLLLKQVFFFGKFPTSLTEMLFHVLPVTIYHHAALYSITLFVIAPVLASYIRRLTSGGYPPAFVV